MDTKVQVLMKTTNCSKSDAERVLKMTDGDLNRSMQILKNAISKTVIFHIKVESREEKIFIILKILQQPLKLIKAYVFCFHNEFDLNIDLEPDDFLKNLEENKTKIDESKINEYKALEDKIESLLNEDFAIKIYNFYLQNDANKIIGEISNLLKKTKLKNIKVSYQTHEVENQIDLLRDTEEMKIEKDINSIELECMPVINPIDGIPVKDLVEGDEILIKIEDTKELGIYLAELVGGRRDDEVLPLLVPIVSKEQIKENELSVKIEIGPGIYGKFTIPSEVKIANKKDVTEFVNPLLDEINFFNQEKIYKNILISLSILAILLLIILFFFIYYG